MWVPSQGWEDNLEEKWEPTAVFLLEKFPGQRKLADYSQWGHKQ